MTDANETGAYEARLEQAAYWRLRLRDEPSLELSPDYLGWISVAENAAAWTVIESAWALTGELRTTPELLDMRQGALARMRAHGRKRAWPSVRVMGGIAAAMVAAVIAAGSYFTFDNGDTYSTGVGERRVILLADGSKISLDAGTALSVRYSAHARRLELKQGRARFDVAHDKNRPFTVTAGGESVVAVGTSFDVERLGNAVLVTLIEGHVVVKGAPSLFAPAALRAPVPLKAGQELVTAAAEKPLVRTANLQTETAWEQGRLVFKDEDLGEAIARVNRYAPEPVIVDPEIASLKVSGIFNAGDIGAFVSAITGYYPVVAVTDDQDRIHLQRR